MTAHERLKQEENELIPCVLENSILETHLASAGRQKLIADLKIMELPEGGKYYLIVVFKWEKAKKWYVTTNRLRDTPRIFKSFDKLNRLLRKIYPDAPLIIFRNQPLPPKAPPH